tara:strand:+ start:1093 stop:1269 length:177 start_codon:yes stop_codon:yes gene_type:complete
LKEIIEISRNNKTRQVVEITTVKGKKNRKGLPFKMSRTRHLSLKSKKKEKMDETSKDA